MLIRYWVVLEVGIMLRLYYIGNPIKEHLLWHEGKNEKGTKKPIVYKIINILQDISSECGLDSIAIGSVRFNLGVPNLNH